MRTYPSRKSLLSRHRNTTPRVQYGALCWRRGRKGLRILLITSRETGRWVIPKGWPMRKRPPHGAAEREAWEEAGVLGTIEAESIGLYVYPKFRSREDWIACAVRVYPLKVSEMLKQYPERHQRDTRWFSQKKAARLVMEPGLSKLIRDFDP